MQNRPEYDIIVSSKTQSYQQKTEVLHMTYYSTQGRNLKRDIFRFCGKISSQFSLPARKFVFAMIFGLLAAKSCHLTKIARKLNEDIALDKTVERLSRNLMEFDGI